MKKRPFFIFVLQVLQLGLLFLGLGAATLSFALQRSTVSFGEPIHTKVVRTDEPAQAARLSSSSGHTEAVSQKPIFGDVVLMRIPLTAEKKRLLTSFSERTSSEVTTTVSTFSLPSRVLLGMNNVPVLDQGPHGTCVTFAVTAALDALLDRGDAVSQLCFLELGDYLETRSYFPSGWDGNFGAYALSRLSEYGYVSLAEQKARTCAGVAAYPMADEADTGHPMSPEEYAALSNDFNEQFVWSSLLLPETRFAPAWTESNQGELLLNMIKIMLAGKNAKKSVRILFGTLLPVEHCSAGACARYHATDDTWALTADIKQDESPAFGGHEMVITGYDDRAVAIDRKGARHRGLLVLRNSWGPYYGDHGDYYMTYEFFKHYVLNIEVLTRVDF